jgi:hypothetical protein
MLCCIGCAIFGVTEVSTDGINFEANGDFAYMNAEAGTAGTAAAPSAVPPNPTVYAPPPPIPESAPQVLKPTAPPPAATIPTEPSPVAAVSESVISEATKNENVEPPPPTVAVDLNTETADTKASDVPPEVGKLPSGEINELD